MTLLELRRRSTRAALGVYASDSFTRADSATTAGSTDSYLGGTTKTWTASAGTWGISANRLYLPVSAADGYLTLDTGSTRHEIRAKINTLPNANNVGVVGAFVDTNNFVLFQVNNTGNAQFFYRSAGSFTSLSATQNGAVVAGDEIALRVDPLTPDPTHDGVLLTFYVNAKVILKIPMTGMPAGTKAGFREDGASTWRISNARAIAVPTRPTLARVGAVMVTGGAEQALYNPSVHFIDGQYVMCYSPDDGLGLVTGLAYSTDLITWTREANNPVLTVGAGEVMATNGDIVKVGTTYIIYYQAQNGAAGATVVNAATATSIHGPYTKQGIVLNGPNTHAADPMVRTKLDGTLEMWYWDPTAGSGIRRATSTDGLAWTDAGFSFRPPACTGEPFFVDDGSGDWHVFYCGATDTTVGAYRSIHEAVSTDSGVTWTYRMYRHTKSAASFETVQVFDPSPVLIGNTLYLLYAGAPVSGGGGGLTGAEIALAIGPWPGRSWPY